jgi:hypothetical protein
MKLEKVIGNEVKNTFLGRGGQVVLTTLKLRLLQMSFNDRYADVLNCFEMQIDSIWVDPVRYTE